VDALGAGADASFNADRGASLGASAYAVQAKGTFGNIGMTRGGDSEVGFGVGAGVGAAGRLHWADEDNDGFREYGFGFDAGPFSFDYKSEDPLRDLMGPMGGLLGDSNLTHATGEAVGDAWDWTKGAASDVADFAGDTYDTVAGGVSDAVDWAGDTASSVGSSISSGVSAAASWVGGVFSGW
jgi:hypothetical protein